MDEFLEYAVETARCTYSMDEYNPKYIDGNVAITKLIRIPITVIGIP
jgi:hypothetical protein